MPPSLNLDLQAPTHTRRLAEAAAYSRFLFEATQREEQLKRDGYSELTVQEIARVEFRGKVERYREVGFGRGDRGVDGGDEEGI